jgi:hypothetical protein
MAEKIDQFIALVRKEGLARNNRFVVYITPPPRLISKYPDDKIRFFCDTASLPGLNFLSNPVQTYGEQREVVYNRSFEPVNLEFLLDTRMEIKQFFDDWQALIIDPVSRIVSYYKDYIGTVEIYQLDSSDKENTRYVARLHEAFPKSVAAVSYSSAGKDISKLSVSIEYKYWKPLSAAKADIPTDEVVSSVGRNFESGAGVQTAGDFNTQLYGQNPLDIPEEGSQELPT